MSIDQPAGPDAERQSLPFSNIRRLAIPRQIGRSLALLFAAIGTSPALELGEAEVRSALGKSLHAEIPYRLAANERILASCVSLAQPVGGANGPPSFTQASRITVSASHIQVFGNAIVREPLIGLDVRIQCDDLPHFMRSYVLFIDPPGPTPAEMSRSPELVTLNRETQAPVVAEIVAPIVAQNVAAPLPQETSPRASGQVGTALSQGQTYRVVRGDTLSGIASRIAGRPGSIWATADAIFAANPAAFANANPDLIQAGRSISIPILTDTAGPNVPGVTAEALPSVPEQLVLPVASPAEPPAMIEVPPVESIARGVEAVAAASSTPAEAPATIPVATPPIAATPAVDNAGIAAPEVAARSMSTLAIVLLAIGAAVLLLLAPALTVLRKRRLDAATATVVSAEEDTIVSLSTLIVESGLPDDAEDDKTLTAQPAPMSPPEADVVDLDTGMPLPGEVPVEWFASDSELEPEPEPQRDLDDATTHVMSREEWRDERNTQTMTMVELELLRQDYEAELTMTQQHSRALREAVEELNATDAARAADDSAAARETSEITQTVVMELRSETKAAEAEAEEQQPPERRASGKA